MTLEIPNTETKTFGWFLCFVRLPVRSKKMRMEKRLALFGFWTCGNFEIRGRKGHFEISFAHLHFIFVAGSSGKRGLLQTTDRRFISGSVCECLFDCLVEEKQIKFPEHLTQAWIGG